MVVRRSFFDPNQPDFKCLVEGLIEQPHSPELTERGRLLFAALVEALHPCVLEVPRGPYKAFLLRPRQLLFHAPDIFRIDYRSLAVRRSDGHLVSSYFRHDVDLSLHHQGVVALPRLADAATWHANGVGYNGDMADDTLTQAGEMFPSSGLSISAIRTALERSTGSAPTPDFGNDQFIRVINDTRYRIRPVGPDGGTLITMRLGSSESRDYDSEDLLCGASSIERSYQKSEIVRKEHLGRFWSGFRARYWLTIRKRLEASLVADADENKKIRKAFQRHLNRNVLRRDPGMSYTAYNYLHAKGDDRLSVRRCQIYEIMPALTEHVIAPSHDRTMRELIDDERPILPYLCQKYGLKSAVLKRVLAVDPAIVNRIFTINSFEQFLYALGHANVPPDFLPAKDDTEAWRLLSTYIKVAKTAASRAGLDEQRPAGDHSHISRFFTPELAVWKRRSVSGDDAEDFRNAVHDTFGAVSGFVSWMATGLVHRFPEVSELPREDFLEFASEFAQQNFNLERQLLRSMSLTRMKNLQKQYHARIDVINDRTHALLPELCWAPHTPEIHLPGGVSLHQLTSSSQLFEEGKEMDNCIGSYVRKCVEGSSIVYSMRTDEGRRVATVEFASDDGQWELREVRTRSNGTAPESILALSYAACEHLNKTGLNPKDYNHLLMSAVRSGTPDQYRAYVAHATHTLLGDDSVLASYLSDMQFLLPAELRGLSLDEFLRQTGLAEEVARCIERTLRQFRDNADLQICAPAA